MKALIAAACVAVIAATGYYFVGEFSKHRERVAKEARVEGARSELFEFAKAKPYEIQKVRDFCKSLDERTDAGGSLADNPIAKGMARNCRYFDYL